MAKMKWNEKKGKQMFVKCLKRISPFTFTTTMFYHFPNKRNKIKQKKMQNNCTKPHKLQDTMRKRKFAWSQRAHQLESTQIM